jgi:hypothetical protein
VTYAKTALWLTTLERMIGWDRTQRVLTTYFARYAFRHPVPRDFFAVASEVSGQDLTWFFDAVYRSAATFDYAVAQVTTEPESGGLTRSVVVVRRLGDGVFPVDIRFTFEDGSTTVERWDGMARWHAIPQVHIGGLRKVEIDPDRVLTLDVSYTNNSWTAEPRAAEAASSWALRWLTWVQSTLLTYAFFI